MALAQLLGDRGQIVDNAGNPLAGGLVNVYSPNTTNRVTSYSDSALVAANANPVELSGSGRADIWISVNCDIRITDKDGNLVSEELSVNPSIISGVFDSGLVPNGSFEIDSDADDVPDGWTEEVTSAGSNNGLDLTQSTDGAQSLRTQSSGSGGGEFRTTAFFPVNDVDDLRVNFDLFSTVATVRNIVRVEWYDVSQISISDTDVYDSTANPATFESQVKTATPPALARFAKLRIMGGVTGGLDTGITYWDRVQVFYPQVVSGVFDNITISGNDIISTNTNGAINLTPNGTGATVVKNLHAGPAGSIALDVSVANDVRIRADIVTATPPVAEAVTALLKMRDSDNTDTLMRLGFSASNVLLFTNRMHGGAVQIEGEDAAGVLRTLFMGDPDDNSSMYAAGVLRLAAHTDAGTAKLYSDTSTDSEDRLLEFAHQDGTVRGSIGWTAGSRMAIENLINGSGITLQANNAGGSTEVLFKGDTGGKSAMYHIGVEGIRTITAGTGGAEVNNTLTAAGFERVVTVSDVTQAASSTVPLALAAGVVTWNSASIAEIAGPGINQANDGYLLDDAGTLKVVPIDQWGMQVQTDNTSRTFGFADMNTLQRVTGGTSRTWTIPPNTTTALEEGGVIVCVNSGTGDLTIQAGTGVVLDSVFHSGGATAQEDRVLDGGTAVLIKTNTDTWALSGDIADT